MRLESGLLRPENADNEFGDLDVPIVDFSICLVPPPEPYHAFKAGIGTLEWPYNLVVNPALFDAVKLQPIFVSICVLGESAISEDRMKKAVLWTAAQIHKLEALGEVRGLKKGVFVMPLILVDGHSWGLHLVYRDPESRKFVS